MISAGHSHSIAFTDSEQLLGWGDNQRGQLGDGSRAGRREPGCTWTGGLCAVSAGAFHSLALTASGEVLAWGSNDLGQLGDGSTSTRLTPTKVWDGARAVSAGWYHSLAVSELGEVLAWGFNKLGQLGDGSVESSLEPVRVVLDWPVHGSSPLPFACSVAAGGRHSLALVRNGQVFAWGANDAGQLGDGTREQRLYPVCVIPSGVTAVAAGHGHSLALTEAGEVFAWGSNEAGQLGDGTQEPRDSPVKVISGGIRSISAGYGHNLAVTENGEVLAWGQNDVGQVGDGSTLNRPTPVKVLEGGICEACAGWYHSLAREPERGLAWAWGGNGGGQLGDGSSEPSLQPTLVIDGQALTLEVHPANFAITLEQLNDLDSKVKATLTARYRGATTRTVVEEVVIPATAHLVNRGYARLLNEGRLLAAQVFVSHAWDSGFGDFIATVNRVLGAQPDPPTLWIAFVALWQAGPSRTAWRPGLDPSDSPFGRVLRRVDTVLVVRSEQVDVYSRLWCVFELFLTAKLGFVDRPGALLIAGSNRRFATGAALDLARCQTSDPQDQRWLSEAIERSSGGADDVSTTVTKVRRLYFR